MGEKTEHEEAFRLSELSDAQTHKTKQQNHDKMTVFQLQIKVPIKVQIKDNIKLHNWKFISWSWGRVIAALL